MTKPDDTGKQPEQPIVPEASAESIEALVPATGAFAPAQKLVAALSIEAPYENEPTIEEIKTAILDALRQEIGEDTQKLKRLGVALQETRSQEDSIQDLILQASMFCAVEELQTDVMAVLKECGMTIAEEDQGMIEISMEEMTDVTATIDQIREQMFRRKLYDACEELITDGNQRALLLSTHPNFDNCTTEEAIKLIATIWIAENLFEDADKSTINNAKTKRTKKQAEQTLRGELVVQAAQLLNARLNMGTAETGQDPIIN